MKKIREIALSRFGGPEVLELRPTAPCALPLAQAAEAHRLLESGQTTGTLVLVP